MPSVAWVLVYQGLLRPGGRRSEKHEMQSSLSSTLQPHLHIRNLFSPWQDHGVELLRSRKASGPPCAREQDECDHEAGCLSDGNVLS